MRAVSPVGLISGKRYPGSHTNAVLKMCHGAKFRRWTNRVIVGVVLYRWQAEFILN